MTDTTETFNKAKVEAYLKERFGNASFTSIEKLGAGVHGIGYAVNFTVDGEEKKLILKTLFPSDFGHDHFSDRAQVLLLAHDAYNRMDNHVRSVDVVGVSDEKLISLGAANEFYVLMEEAHGIDYFADLNAIRERGSLTELDKKRALILSDFLVSAHKEKHDNPVLYKRRVRDCIGHGECLMGIFDTYPAISFSTDDEMAVIVGKAVKWWGKIKNKSHRLCAVHGDYHPGNIWWRDDASFTLLDRSRGMYGEPGDDVSCLSINYIFYALLQSGGWRGPFRELFDIFYTNYFEKTGDDEMRFLLPMFYAFRVAVIANPLFYPDVSDEARRKLFNFASNVLDHETFDPDAIDAYLETTPGAPDE